MCNMAANFVNIFGRSKIYRCSRSFLRSKSRTFCTNPGGGNAAQDITNIPLSETVPWIPAPKYASVADRSSQTQVTTLENGLRVASEEKFGNFCTVGVLIDSGSRYEVAYPSGITHFLEKLAFSSTTKYESRDAILQKLEEHGGICDCQGSRDTLIYAASANTSGLPEVVDLLSEVVLRSNVSPEELEDAKLAVGFELETLDMRPDPEPLLVEIIHAAAYSSNTLGLPKICPPESLSMINKNMLYTYMQNYHIPERMVIAGVGMQHEALVESAQKYFVEKRPVWDEDVSLIDTTRGQDKSISQYTGGIIQIEKDLSSVSLGPTPMPELAHCVVGLESCSHKDPDFIAFCVLNMVMGGGGSFSAGGPGKGMYTRLYLNVLNRYHWMHNATAYNHAYLDSGIFCVHASAHPSMMKDVLEVIVKELVHTQHGIGDIELSRAKTQLQSMLLMNLESRPVMFEDIGRQVLASDKRLPAKYYYDEIGKITEDDIKRVARRMLSSKPSVGCLGDLSHMPSFADISAALASKDGRFPRKFTLFS